MYKPTPPPPRRLDLLSQVILIFSDTFVAWIILLIGSCLAWVFLTEDFPGVTEEGEVIGPIIAYIFLGIGVITFFYAFRKGFRRVVLLRYGEFAWGTQKLTENTSLQQLRSLFKIVPDKLKQQVKEHADKFGMKQEEGESDEDFFVRVSEQEIGSKKLGNSSSQADFNYLCKFEFTTKNGQTFTTKEYLQSIQKEKVVDDEQERILYMSNNPERSMLFDAIPGVPDISGAGSFSQVALGQGRSLLAGIAVLLINFLIADYMWSLGYIF